MSAIPPNWISSVVGAQGAAQRSAEARAKEEAAETRRTTRPTFDKALQEVIETQDADTQVYSDAEGSGSQGRASSEQHEHKPHDEAPPDEDAAGGLDVRA
ncbi:MAG: hypothetical protein AB7Q17_12070 [Phycisphaerae bacterium]